MYATDKNERKMKEYMGSRVKAGMMLSHKKMFLKMQPAREEFDIKMYFSLLME